MPKKYQDDKVDANCNVLMSHAFNMAQALLAEKFPRATEPKLAEAAEKLAFKTLKTLLTQAPAQTERTPVLH